MKGKFIAGSGDEGTASVIEIAGEQYECMDCLGYGRSRSCKPGDVVYVAFSAGLVKSDRRGNVVAGANPQQRKALDPLGGWHYRAYGAVVSVAPSGTVLDCGAVTVEMPAVLGADAIGSFVAVDIDRLDCWRTRQR